MALAIFDLDNTLLGGDSDHAWGEFLVARGLVDAVSYREGNDRYYRAYQEGTLDIHEFLAFALEPLTRIEAETLRRLQEEFLREMIEPMRLPRAEALLTEHRERGDLLLIITATHSVVTRPIAALLGVEHLLATEPEVDGGRYTGRVAGVPCFREGKVERLQAWLGEHGQALAGAHFYSDSHNDLPLLERVDHPVAVDPDPQLESTARERGWRVISLRE